MKIPGRLETRVSFANIPHRVYEEVPTMSLTTLLGDIGGVMVRVKHLLISPYFENFQSTFLYEIFIHTKVLY